MRSVPYPRFEHHHLMIQAHRTDRWTVTVYYRYHNNRQGTLMVIDKYTKSSVSHHTTSEVGTFDQSDGDSNKHIPQYDLKYWNNMQCFRCLHKGLPALHCTKIIINTNGYKQSDDGKSKFIKSSNSRKITRQKV